MKKLSIKLRITLWYTLAMLIVSLVAFVAMNSLSQNIIKRELSNRVVEIVEEVSRQISGPDGRFRPMPGIRFYGRGVHMALYDSEGNLIDGRIPYDNSVDFEADELREKDYDGDKYFEYDKEIKLRDGTSLWLKGIISVAAEDYAVRSAQVINAVLMLILILTAAVGGYFIISRAFVPVNKIAAAAKEISESRDLSRRIEIGDSKDEISSLANIFDDMLDKIEQSFEKEKQFTSDASHELRTPVAVIMSECEYMEECANSPEEFKESAASVKRQADKMSKLISELLMISRMDKNTLKLSFEDTDVSELLSFVCDEQQEIQGGSITLIRDIQPDIIVETDRMLLARVFINLISNAYQYSKEEGEITVSLARLGGEVILSVTDKGIGIAEENVGKIWERFYQAEPSRTANENGSMGLGLSMVKQIADVLGGDVSVESKFGVGSKFVFRLPIFKL